MSEEDATQGIRSQRVDPQVLSAPAGVASVHRDWIAVPDGRRGDVLLWSGVSGGNISAPVKLSGLHTSRVTALRLAGADGEGGLGQGALFTASADCVVRWGIGAEGSVLQDGDIHGHIIAQGFESAAHVAANRAGNKLLVCDGLVTHFIDVETGHFAARLEGHTAAVSAAEFRESDADRVCVVSVSEDRRFLIFDLTSRSLVYQSAIVSASPFISLSIEPGGGRCAVGAADGRVRVYDLTKQDHRVLQVIDVSAAAGLKDRPWEKRAHGGAGSDDVGTVVISSEPAWKRIMDAQAAMAEEDADSANLSDIASRQCPVIALSFLAPSSAEQQQHQPPQEAHSGTEIRMSAAGGQRTSSNEWADMHRRAPALVIGTPSCVLISSIVSGEIMRAVWLEAGPTPSESGCVKRWHTLSVGTVGSMHMCTHSSNYLCLATAAAFTPTLHVSLIPPPLPPVLAPGGDAQAQFTSADGVVASVFPCTQPPAGSILSEPIKQQQSSDLPRQGSSSTMSSNGSSSSSKAQQLRSQSHGRESLSSIMRTSGVTKDQPLTFHTKIKSSSYGATPPQAMFKPNTQKKPPSKAISKGSSSSSLLSKQYPPDAPLPRNRQTDVDAHAPQHTAPIRRIAFAPDAGRVASASADKTISVVRAPLRKHAGEASFLTGHSAPVNTVAWSRDSQFLVSSAADRTVRLWSPDRSTCEALLVMDRRLHQRKLGVTKQEDDANPTFQSDVRDASFFYMDKFVAAAVGKQLLLYSFSLADMEGNSKDDIERLKKKHKYKLVASLETSAQSVTAMTCVNGFLSHIILAAGSHKHVEVWDVGVEKMIHTIQDVHDKPAQCIRLNDCNTFSSHPSESYDLLLSVGAGGGGGAGAIHIWDLRTGARVCRLAGHTNRVHPVGASFSPCLRYVASGSEDKQAYVYDIRNGSGTFLDKLGGHLDVVGDVCFNPLHPQIVTACNDGKIRSFVDKE